MGLIPACASPPGLQADNVHGKDPVLAMRAVASAPGRAGIIVSLSTKKCARVYSMQVMDHAFEGSRVPLSKRNRVCGYLVMDLCDMIAVAA